jgi:hypothetical protein
MRPERLEMKVEIESGSIGMKTQSNEPATYMQFNVQVDRDESIGGRHATNRSKNNTGHEANCTSGLVRGARLGEEGNQFNERALGGGLRGVT